MNRLIYDNCAYARTLNESVAPINYLLDPVKYEHCSKCRIELGLVGGAGVSHISGNLVDLENDLRGQNRPNTHCPAYKFTPSSKTYVQGKEYIKPVCHPKVDTTPVHMRSCQMHDWPGVPMPQAAKPFVCPM